LLSEQNENAGEVTRHLRRWRSGDPSALAELTPLIYPELRRLAAIQLRRESGPHTWQPTELVNEAFVRLMGNNPDVGSRGHFFAVAARLMRQILVDHARRRMASKRGEGRELIELDQVLHLATHKEDEIVVALHDALGQLALVDQRKAEAVELRFFGGMSHREIAEFCGTSVPTVVRDLRMAEAWLRREIGTEAATLELK
jgi:RNA polymerase sigma factor (TIGR02999 family)